MSTLYDKTGLMPDQAPDKIARQRALIAELVRTLETIEREMASFGRHEGPLLKAVRTALAKARKESA